MDEEFKSVSTFNATKFEPEERLTRQQFSDYWELFPFKARKSINKTKRGELPPCSDSDLKNLLESYLGKNECGSSSSLKCAE